MDECSLGVVGLALNLRATSLVKKFVQQKTQNLKHSIQKSIIKRRYAWMAAQDQPHERLVFPRRYYHVETLFNVLV
jgi:photosystem II P680 reaction center D2 protein